MLTATPSANPTVLAHIASCKTDCARHSIPLDFQGYRCQLVPLAAWMLDRPELVRLLVDWRRQNQMAYPSVFNVTFAGTKRWVERALVEDPQRLLFGLFDADGCMVGHAGLATFDWARGDCEIDNVMRGEAPAPRGLMTAVVNRLVSYAYDEFGMTSVSLRVFGDNFRAIKLYHRCGFAAVESIPMGCVLTDDGVSWTHQDEFSNGQTYRIFLRMRHCPAQPNR